LTKPTLGRATKSPRKLGTRLTGSQQVGEAGHVFVAGCMLTVGGEATSGCCAETMSPEEYTPIGWAATGHAASIGGTKLTGPTPLVVAGIPVPFDGHP